MGDPSPPKNFDFAVPLVGDPLSWLFSFSYAKVSTRGINNIFVLRVVIGLLNQVSAYGVSTPQAE